MLHTKTTYNIAQNTEKSSIPCPILIGAGFFVFRGLREIIERSTQVLVNLTIWGMSSLYPGALLV